MGLLTAQLSKAAKILEKKNKDIAALETENANLRSDLDYVRANNKDILAVNAKLRGLLGDTLKIIKGVEDMLWVHHRLKLTKQFVRVRKEVQEALK